LIQYINMKSKGFTLIELLVVISIIALLSSVVLSSLGAARSKAADNAVKSVMKGMRTQAQTYLDANSTLGAAINLTPATGVLCTSGVFNDSIFKNMQTNIYSNAAPSATIICRTSTNGELWAFSLSALRGGGSWCVDNSQGWFKAGSANTAGKCQ